MGFTPSNRWSAIRSLVLAAAMAGTGLALVPNEAEAMFVDRRCICTSEESPQAGGCTYPFSFCCDFFGNGSHTCGCVFGAFGGECINDE